jgi:signal transduction histidine kinase
VNSNPQQRSLRLWLQSSSLIAVLAGYGVLLAVGSWITQLDRLQSHRQLVLSISRELARRRPADHSFQVLPVLGVEVLLESPARPAHPPMILRRGESLWFTSRSTTRRPGLPPASLVVSQNVTVSIQRERTLLLLLIAAAGLASLFTSALLRQVMKRGLVLPIEAFCRQLQVAMPSAGAQLISEVDQPQELQPIAAAFNERQQRLSAAWKRERTFTDGVAHELRTPITLISGQAQSLLRQPLADEQRRAVVSIAAEARHMTTLVRDLLDLARQDGDRLGLQCRPVDPEALMLDAFDRLRPLAPQRLQLVPAGAAVPPEAVQADPDRLLQCISALVDNALAYSTGPVELELCAYPNQVVWHVRDRGPGVQPQERAAIFQRFVRGSAAAHSDSRGSGLGLAVVRLLMEAMGGWVAVAAVPGGGADFQLRLPLRDPAVSSSQLSPPAHPAAD